ncbi:MAG: hypothetical protein HKN16_05725, partial [Saprospiraceae bacterium]|nr:hypothetical protein [Saprospiraceae bacterium]
TWKKPNSNFKFPKTLTFSSKEDKEESGRRLFYVSLTRAKRHLYISWPLSGHGKRPPEPSPYVSELLEILGLENAEPKQVPIEVLKGMMESMHQEIPEIKVEDLPKETIDFLLKDFRLSASALNTYIRCPLSFYFDHVLKIPSRSSAAASFGTAMHRALYRMYLPINDDQKILPLDSVINVFEEEMTKMRGFFEDHIYESRMELGKENLELFYNDNKDNLPKNILLEHKIYNAELDGVPLGGDIDRVDLKSSTEAYIFDYKTVKPRSEKLKKADDKVPYGGDYWRQLQFYKILFDAQFPNKTVSRSAILYLGKNAKGELQESTVALDKESQDKVKGWVKEVYQNIKDHNFYAGCEDSDCNWCEFSRQTNFNQS